MMSEHEKGGEGEALVLLGWGGERGGDAQVVDPAHLNEGDVEVGEGGTVGIARSWEAVGSG